MTAGSRLVLPRQRHLKWPALHWLERWLMVVCGVTLLGFSTSVICDIVTRTIGHPWLWLQEVTSTFFVYGIFAGAAVATRRSDHLYLTAVSESMHGRARLAVEGAQPSGYGLGKAGWVTVPLRAPGVSLDVLRDWVEESYRIVAPKRVVAELDALS